MKTCITRLLYPLYSPWLLDIFHQRGNVIDSSPASKSSAPSETKCLTSPSLSRPQKLSRTTWPETQRPRIIMRPRDLARSTLSNKDTMKHLKTAHTTNLQDIEINILSIAEDHPSEDHPHSSDDLSQSASRDDETISTVITIHAYLTTGVIMFQGITYKLWEEGVNSL